MMPKQATAERKTKYCIDIEHILREKGHATNVELLHELRKRYPTLTATTVHRATLRLASRGKISLAPPSKDGSTRYDSNLQPHDHFQCTNCEKLLDTDIRNKIITVLEETINGCSFEGRLTISGICKRCIEGGNI